MIFDIGKQIFLDQLFFRDESFAERWENANGHLCLVDNGEGKIQCWCSCSRNSPTCQCSCAHIFHILIEKIREEYGALNMNAKLKYVLATVNDDF